MWIDVELDEDGNEIIQVARTRKTPCVKCWTSLTWDHRKKQYRPRIEGGLTPDEAKAAMPRCQKCMTVFLRNYPRTAGTPFA